jgi:hypothetical protein
MMAKDDDGDCIRADRAFEVLNPDTDDATIAAAVAECLTAKHGPYYFAISHDVRPSTPRKIAKRQKLMPNYVHAQRFGPCPLRYDWRYKNTVGIKERDRETAKRWVIGAMLSGYAVFSKWSIAGPGIAFSKGTLADIRKRARERQKWEVKSKQRREPTGDVMIGNGGRA